MKNKSNSPSSIDSSLTPRALLALADSLSQEFESESTDQPTSKITEDPTNDSTLLDISEFEIPQSQAEYLNRIQDGWAIGTSNNDNHNNATINIPNSPPKFSMAETDSSVKYKFNFKNLFIFEFLKISRVQSLKKFFQAKFLFKFKKEI